MPLPCSARVPSLTPVCLYRARLVQGTERIPRRLTSHTLHAVLLRTGEDPRALKDTPKQTYILMAPLVLLSCETS